MPVHKALKFTLNFNGIRCQFLYLTYTFSAILPKNFIHVLVEIDRVILKFM